MTLDETTEKKVYSKLRAFDGVELAGHEPVNSSIASVLSEGEVLGDDGNQYSSIQTAVDNSDSWVFIGPGTFYENVVIDKDNFMLQGAGSDTLIDGGATGEAIDVNGANTVLKDFSARTTGSSFTAVECSGQNSIIENVRVLESSGRGINASGDNSIIRNCYAKNTASNSLRIAGGVGSAILDSTSESNTYGITLGHDCIVANCIILDTSNTGIASNRNDSIIIGNRVINSGDDGIALYSDATDNIVANNRISGSTNSNIDVTNATGTITDGNLTGAAN